MRILKQLVLVFTVPLVTIGQTTYAFDKNHSRLAFTATHFAISEVDGHFKTFSASLRSAKDDFSDAVIHMTADAKSIDTNVGKRDKDLRGADWLNVAKFPEIEFKSTAFKNQGGKNYKLEGTITIRGVTKPIVFDVVYNGTALNPMSKKSSVGFTVKGKLNRKDFGIGTDALESAVGKEVELKANVEFIVN